jgi:tryptophan synthase beta chain
MKDHLENFYTDYIGRPTPLYHAKTLSEYFGANIYLKREDLNHTGSLQINNAFEQLYFAKTQGYCKVYLETKDKNFVIACGAVCARLKLSLYIKSKYFDLLSGLHLHLYGAKKIEKEVIDTSFFTQTRTIFHR